MFCWILFLEKGRGISGKDGGRRWVKREDKGQGGETREEHKGTRKRGEKVILCKDSFPLRLAGTLIQVVFFDKNTLDGRF